MTDQQRVTRNKACVDDILASEKRIAELITSTKRDLQDSIDGVRQDFQEMKDKVSAMEVDVEKHESELSKLREELVNERAKRTQLERQYILKDIHDRRQNLLFYGIPESPQENTEKVLREFLVDKLKFAEQKAFDIFFKVVHRLPVSEYQKANNPNAVRSIIASFVYMPDREVVFDARKILRKSGISIQTDLPPLLKKRRAILSRQAATLRQEKGVWTRVRVVSTEVVLETRDPQKPGSPWVRSDNN